jgi:FMN phosphatase YigB (HAD superfamily)
MKINMRGRIIIYLMKIMVSDMGGVLYSFDKSYEAAKHQLAFDEVMEKMGKENDDIKSQLEGEYEAIQKGELTVYPMENGINNLRKNIGQCKVVIVSTSLVKTSKLILERFGLSSNIFDIYDMSDYGSKKDKGVWKKIFLEYESIDFIVEDGRDNLEAAKAAARELGYSPETFIEMPVVN